MIGRPLPHRPARFGEMGSAFPDFGTVEISGISKSRPDRIDWMRFQRSIDLYLPRNQCRPAARINHPASGYIANLSAHPNPDLVFALSTQFQILHFGWTP